MKRRIVIVAALLAGFAISSCTVQTCPTYSKQTKPEVEKLSKEDKRV